MIELCKSIPNAVIKVKGRKFIKDDNSKRSMLVNYQEMLVKI